MQKRTYWYWGGTLGTLIIIGCALIVLQGDTITPKDRTIGNLGRIEFLLVEFVDAFSHFPDTLTELTNSLTSSFQLDDGWGHPICYIKTNDIVIRSYERWIASEMVTMQTLVSIVEYSLGQPARSNNNMPRGFKRFDV